MAGRRERAWMLTVRLRLCAVAVCRGCGGALPAGDAPGVTGGEMSNLAVRAVAAQRPAPVSECGERVLGVDACAAARVCGPVGVV
ncbi:hypothetical protein GCM10020218_046440 [Dactylosporangium vinaceum]